MSKVAYCRDCGAAILWAVTRTGKRMPVDADPTSLGDLALATDWDGTLQVRQAFAGEDRRYTSHFATCPSADLFRRPKPRPAEGPAQGAARRRRGGRDGS